MFGKPHQVALDEPWYVVEQEADLCAHFVGGDIGGRVLEAAAGAVELGEGFRLLVGEAAVGADRVDDSGEAGEVGRRLKAGQFGSGFESLV